MAIKITRRIKINDLTRKLREQFKRQMPKVVNNLIKEKILGGSSPVEGFKKFPPYSVEYSKLKGKKAPVDLFVTGDLIESLKVSTKGLGEIKAAFTDKKAAFHNGNSEGIRKQGQKLSNGLPVRRVLPDRSGEKFTKSILNKILSKTNRIASQEVNKSNR